MTSMYEPRYTLTKPFGGRPAGTRVRLRTYQKYEEALNQAVIIACQRRPYIKDVVIVELECREIGYTEVDVDGVGDVAKVVTRPMTADERAAALAERGTP